MGRFTYSSICESMKLIEALLKTGDKVVFSHALHSALMGFRHIANTLGGLEVNLRINLHLSRTHHFWYNKHSNTVTSQKYS